MNRTAFLGRVIARIAFFVMVLLGATGSGHAQPLATVALPTGDAHVQPLSEMRFYLDPSRKLTMAKVERRRDAFRPVTTRWVDFGMKDARIWLLVRVANETGQDNDWLLDLQRSFVDDLQVARIDPATGRGHTLLKASADTPFAARPVNSRNLVVPLRMKAGQTSDILIGYTASSDSWMPVTFATPERMRTAYMHEGRINWLVNGALAALIVTALCMGRLIGWPLVLAFAAYTGAGALFVANNEGYLHYLLWPNRAVDYQLLNLGLMLFMVVSGLQFARTFARLSEHRQSLDRFVFLFQCVLLALLVVVPLLGRMPFFAPLVFAAVPVGVAFYLLAGLTAWRTRVEGGLPFLVGSLAVLATLGFAAAILRYPGRLPNSVGLDFMHLTVLAESLAFLVAILVRMLAMQRALNRSLEQEVRSTRERLALAEELNESRNRYDKAQRHAEQLRSRLAATSHDLQQPLLSLRQGLAARTGDDSETARGLRAALEYLENVTSSGLADSQPDDALAGEKPDEGAETFPVSIVLDNCMAMFRGEAEKGGVELRVRSHAGQVHTDPVEFLRSVSNLVSNALKHSGADTVLIAARGRDDHVLVHVIDNGRGMDDAEIERLRQAYTKSEDSAGHGLGLALVSAFGMRPGHDFVIRSRPGRGSCFTIRIPVRE